VNPAEALADAKPTSTHAERDEDIAWFTSPTTPRRCNLAELLDAEPPWTGDQGDE